MSLQNLFRIQSEYSASNDTDIRRQNYGFCPRRRYHYDVIRIVTFIPETPKLQCICFLATLETPHDSIFGETSAKRANNFQNAQSISTSDTCKQHLPEAKVGSRILRRTQKKDFPGWVHIIMKTNLQDEYTLNLLMLSGYFFLI